MAAITMNLSNLNMTERAEEGAILHLLHPGTGEELFNDDKTPMTINLVGMDSAAYKRAEKRINNRITKGRKVKMRTAEQIGEDACEALSECTTGWNLFADEKTKLKFSVKAARELYLKEDWIKEQVDRFVGDRASFLPSA